MTDRWLIAHKVRGEAAFDVASKIGCPECEPCNGDSEYVGCVECDYHGFWWIIPTSGHRAYPYWWGQDLERATDMGVLDAMPPNLPDHYTTRAEPKAPKRNLLAEIGLAKPAGMVGTLKRRI